MLSMWIGLIRTHILIWSITGCGSHSYKWNEVSALFSYYIFHRHAIINRFIMYLYIFFHDTQRRWICLLGAFYARTKGCQRRSFFAYVLKMSVRKLPTLDRQCARTLFQIHIDFASICNPRAKKGVKFSAATLRIRFFFTKKISTFINKTNRKQ